MGLLKGKAAPRPWTRKARRAARPRALKTAGPRRRHAVRHVTGGQPSGPSEKAVERRQRALAAVEEAHRG